MRIALNLARGILAGAAATLVALIAATALTGGSTFTILSGSMEPTLSTGDLAIAKPLSPRDARVGDVVTFTSTEHDGAPVTHRVAQVRVGEKRVAFVTKGDANDTAERWHMPVAGELRRVVVHVPLAGYALAETRKPAGRIGLMVVPGLLLLAVALARIWKPVRTEETREALA